MTTISAPYDLDPTPELISLGRALSDWLNSAGVKGRSGDDVTGNVVAVTRAARFMSACRDARCRTSDQQFHPPYRLEEHPAGFGWLASYRCPKCGSEHTKSWPDDGLIL